VRCSAKRQQRHRLRKKQWTGNKAVANQCRRIASLSCYECSNFGAASTWKIVKRFLSSDIFHCYRANLQVYLGSSANLKISLYCGPGSWTLLTAYSNVLKSLVYKMWLHIWWAEVFIWVYSSSTLKMQIVSNPGSHGIHILRLQAIIYPCVHFLRFPLKFVQGKP